MWDLVSEYADCLFVCFIMTGLLCISKTQNETQEKPLEPQSVSRNFCLSAGFGCTFCVGTGSRPGRKGGEIRGSTGFGVLTPKHLSPLVKHIASNRLQLILGFLPPQAQLLSEEREREAFLKGCRIPTHQTAAQAAEGRRARAQSRGQRAAVPAPV